MTFYSSLVATIAALTISIALLTSGALTTEPQPPAVGSGETLAVAADGTAEFATISAAIDAAADGDTVSVSPGTYVESILIDKSIELRGNGSPEEVIISAPEDGPLVAIESPWGLDGWEYAIALVGSDAVVSNLSVVGEGSDVLIDGGDPRLEGIRHIDNAVVISGGSTSLLTGGSYEAAGISVFDASEPTIESGDLSGGSYIELYAGDGAVVQDNTIADVVLHAIEVRAPTRMLIEDNEISGGPGAGIAVGDSIDSAAGYDPTVRGNTISGMATGIFLAPRSNALIEGNIVSQAATGISVSAGSAAEVIGNTVEDVTVGVSVSDADPVIRGNQLRRHTTGLLLIASAALVDGNLVEDGKNGIVLSGPSTNPTLIANTVCGNETNVKAAAGAPEPDLSGNDVCGDLAVAE